MDASPSRVKVCCWSAKAMINWKMLSLAGAAGMVALALAGVVLFAEREAETPSLVQYQAQYVDAGAMLRLTETLSSDALEGRATGTRGNEAARDFIQKRFETLGLQKLGKSWAHPFTAAPDTEGAQPVDGANVTGLIKGRTDGPVLLITAHFDHLGIVDGEIYNGADDNASGTAALVDLAHYFSLHQPVHDIVFAALDGEEIGLLGAHALLDDPDVPMDRVVLNLNFDMVSRSEAGELYVAGTFHNPELLPLVERIAAEAPVKLIAGHDDPALGEHEDWTAQSDHAVFHEAGIAFLYFGVEDHPGYHQPTDDYADITPDFFVRAGDTLVMAALAIDDELDLIGGEKAEE
jgi:hypothetical protein